MRGGVAFGLQNYEIFMVHGMGLVARRFLIDGGPALEQAGRIRLGWNGFMRYLCAFLFSFFCPCLLGHSLGGRTVYFLVVASTHSKGIIEWLG